MTAAELLTIIHGVSGVNCRTGNVHGTLCQHIQDVALAVQNDERVRATRIARFVRDQAMGIAQKAQAAGDTVVRDQAGNVAQASEAIAKAIELPEGACQKCSGTKRVASRLMAGASVPCLDCAPADRSVG
jgi:hypothetical protein